MGEYLLTLSPGAPRLSGKKLLNSLLNPNIVGLLIGLFVAVVPGVSDIFIAREKPVSDAPGAGTRLSRPPLGFITNALNTFGGAGVGVVMLVVSATLGKRIDKMTAPAWARRASSMARNVGRAVSRHVSRRRTGDSDDAVAQFAGENFGVYPAPRSSSKPHYSRTTSEPPLSTHGAGMGPVTSDKNLFDSDDDLSKTAPPRSSTAPPAVVPGAMPAFDEPPQALTAPLSRFRSNIVSTSSESSRSAGLHDSGQAQASGEIVVSPRLRAAGKKLRRRSLTAETDVDTLLEHDGAAHRGSPVELLQTVAVDEESSAARNSALKSSATRKSSAGAYHEGKSSEDDNNDQDQDQADESQPVVVGAMGTVAEGPGSDTAPISPRLVVCIVLCRVFVVGMVEFLLTYFIADHVFKGPDAALVKLVLYTQSFTPTASMAVVACQHSGNLAAAETVAVAMVFQFLVVGLVQIFSLAIAITLIYGG